MSTQKEEHYGAELHCIEEDEIDLRELWQTIKEGKKIIFTTVFIIVSLTFVYVLSVPNSYKTEAILIPSSQDGGMASKLGGLGGLAAMAGVNLGTASMTPDVAFQSLLNNYGFMKKFVEDNGIYEYYSRENFDENYVFAFNFRTLYDLLHSKRDSDEEKNKEDAIFELIKKLKTSFSINADKKSGLITIAYIDYDREYGVKMVNMFLKDASAYLIENSLHNINSRLNYFEKEMNRVEAFELRQSLSQIISQILQEKVMMKSKQYYQCDVLTSPKVPYVKDKAKPKRGLILIVSFITSLILGVFIVFFLNFIRESKEEKI
jgi:LPS O-antigen subunit length determinant protein (WzzB/FepE family)